MGHVNNYTKVISKLLDLASCLISTAKMVSSIDTRDKFWELLLGILKLLHVFSFLLLHNFKKDITSNKLFIVFLFGIIWWLESLGFCLTNCTINSSQQLEKNFCYNSIAAKKSKTINLSFCIRLG